MRLPAIAALAAAIALAAACTRDHRNVGQELQAAARVAQDRCYRVIHHDTFAFQACIEGLLQEEKAATPRRLGIEYFGWVGALNSARLGMRGADATAYEFMRRFRATQKALGIDAAVLCQAVPGDCDARLARLNQMEASPPPPESSRDDEAPGHRD